MSIHLELIKNDFFLFRQQFFYYSLMAFLSFILMTTPEKSANQLGAFVLIFTMVAFSSNLVMKMIIMERKNQIHLFLMTLPITPQKFNQLKIAGITAMFLCFWTPVFIINLLISHYSVNFSAFSLAFNSMGFCILLPSFAIFLTAAIASKSESVTTLAFVASNIIVFIFFNLVPNFEFAQQAFKQGSQAHQDILWPHQVNFFLATEVGVFLALILLCFLIAQKRRAFID